MRFEIKLQLGPFPTSKFSSSFRKMSTLLVKYDVAVIGGGVVGCAVLNALTENGLTCVMCERNSDLVAEASSGNSGIVHTGFDVQPGSIEHKCLEMSRGLNKKVFDKYNIPFKELGALMVAWNEEEVAKLPGVVQQAHTSGVTDVYQITREELREREPYLSQDALGAVCIPGEGIVDSWLFPIMMAHNAKQQGAEILRACNLFSGSQDENGDWLLITNTGQIRARAVVNCAGLQGDIVEKINTETSFKIFPRKGQFVVFDDTSGSLLNSIILPLPSDKTKGVLLFPTVYGNLVVGPTSEEHPNRDKWHINNRTSKSLETLALKLVPSLSKHHTVAVYAGLRPASQYKDYQLKTHADRNWITVGGIRSTGLSAATGIASHIAQQVQTVLSIFPHATSHKLLHFNRQCSAEDVAKQLKTDASSSSSDDNEDDNNNLQISKNGFSQRFNVRKGHLMYEGAGYRITHLLSKLGLDPTFKPNL